MDSQITQRLIPRLAATIISNTSKPVLPLRVTVKDLNKVDSEALQNEGALGVIIMASRCMPYLAGSLMPYVSY